MLLIIRRFTLITSVLLLSSCAGTLYPDCRTFESNRYAWIDSKKQVAPKEIIEQCTKQQALQTAQQCEAIDISPKDGLCKKVVFSKPINVKGYGQTHVWIGLAMRSCMNPQGYDFEPVGINKSRSCTMNGLPW